MWENRILTWSDFQDKLENNLFFQDVDSILYDSINAFHNQQVNFFTSRLSGNELYRVALTFPEDVMFLDIETTGLSHYYDFITIIGWSTGINYHYFVNGLSNSDFFLRAIEKAKVLITFNGKIFDVPFLKKLFPEIKIPSCHIDLRFFSSSIGLKGGQKEIERLTGYKRIKSLQDTNGFTATVLWDEYKWGKKSSLKKLIRYNHSDIEGMKYIFDYVVKYIYKENDYDRFFENPLEFSKNLKSKFDSSEVSTFVDINKIPFDPKSKLKFDNLKKKINRKSIKIVGIDLTGSEERASGIALLTNNRVETFALKKSSEIIDLVKKLKPDLVSIDSPLSLPFGRTSVFDDDPVRDEFGILRICERILKQRGVNAYPTLLPSMQKLTKRGIEFADIFRKLGIPVIESYPGVIQDIIGLPRKQASLRLLKKGLQKFGLSGNFINSNVSHDEIDAITSAIVGIFFLSKDYEAIGDRKENLMIIPNLNAEVKSRKIIGFSGAICSGKTTAAKYLESVGFHYESYSSILKEMLKKRRL